MPEEKYAVLIEDSYYTPGDERSRTHPGHGYPASTTHYTKVKKFDNKEEWVKWIDKATKDKEKFTAIIYKEATIKMNVTVDIDIVS